MGWSNEIPNPLVVGGTGSSGRIEILNALDQLLGLIDETGITVYGIGTGNYVTLGENIGRSYIHFLPQSQPGTTYAPGKIYTDTFFAPDYDPYLYIEAPCESFMDFPYVLMRGQGLGADTSYIYIWGGSSFELHADDIGINPGTGLGFFHTAPVTQRTVTGSRGGNAALASLLTALATYGLIINNTTP